MTRQVASAKLPTAINCPEWHFKALTEIWTGNAEGNNKCLITTGLLGSIRWWYEVLVRGLGGYACDPTSDAGNRCPGKDKGKTKKYDEKGHRCAVCELFGCTGWSRKFRFEVLDESGEPFTGPIVKDNNKFILRFVPLRRIAPAEWALLDLTLRLISGYGAIGGKTVYKPFDEQNRQGEQYHKDYGLCRLIENKNISPVTDMEVNTADEYISKLAKYLDKWRKEPSSKGFSWASLDNFWCVKGAKRYLTRKSSNTCTFNRILGRDERKLCQDCNKVHYPPQKCPETNRHPRRYSDNPPTDSFKKWLAGARGESKKVFSFKDIQEHQTNGRTFGFVGFEKSNEELENIKKELQQIWPEFNPDNEFLTRKKILNDIIYDSLTKCSKAGDAS
jgi:CRISPR-associated protein Cmr1